MEILLTDDAQIIATLLESIAHSPRFKSADLTDKRLGDLIRMIDNSDLSPTGQAELRSEWASNPYYKYEIAAYIVQVKDSGFPVADINANVNSAKTGKKRERRIIFLGDIFFRSTSQEMHLSSAVQNPLDLRGPAKS